MAEKCCVLYFLNGPWERNCHGLKHLRQSTNRNLNLDWQGKVRVRVPTGRSARPAGLASSLSIPGRVSILRVTLND